jgi:hypothetical protein
MSLGLRLRRLDARVFPRLRQPGEPAEAYLRRVAVRRLGIGVADGYAVQQALREHFAALDRERGA